MLEDGSTTGMSYEVGSGNLMEGLDDAVRGLSADESKTFSTALLSGPNAGESAEVTVTVRSVKTKDLPELDDEFASTASEFDTLAELRDDVRTRLARTKTLQQGAQARDKLVEHLLEVVEVPVPENLVEREIEWRNRAFEQELQQAGMDWDSYLQDRRRPRTARPTTPSSARTSRRPCARSSSSTRSPTPVRSPSTTTTCRRRSWRRPSAAG